MTKTLEEKYLEAREEAMRMEYVFATACQMLYRAGLKLHDEFMCMWVKAHFSKSSRKKIFRDEEESDG